MSTRATNPLWTAALLAALAAVPVSGEPTKVIRGFADFNFSASDESGKHAQFGLGQYDTYVTGTLDDRLSYLSEVTFDYAGSAWTLAVERLWVRYYFGEYLSVSAGKFHTAIGYWNRAYHHGSLLFDSIDKPSTRRLFPIHTTGLLFSGRELTRARLYYDLMLGNGIASTPKEDSDDRKSFNLHLYTKLVEGADIGLSLYWDEAPAGPYGAAKTAAIAHGSNEIGVQRAALFEDVEVFILAPSLALARGRFAAEAEAVLAHSKGQDSGVAEWSKAAYALVSYDMDPWVPFAKFDYLKTEATDPLYKAADARSYAAGLRFDVSELATLKVQYTYRDAAAGVNALDAQLAVGF